MWLFFTLLAAALWAGVNVIDSMVIHKYEGHPIVLLWFSGPMKIPLLLFLYFFFDIQTPWAPQLFLGGVVLYIAACLYFYILKYVDASVTQSAWAIESIFLSIVGFLWLNETWTQSQAIGAVLILAGIFILTYWHKHISMMRTIGLLTALAIVASPSEINIKMAVSDGTTLPAAVFWYMLGLGISAVIFPLPNVKLYRRILTFARNAPLSFYVWFSIDALIAFIAYFCIAKAYTEGALSLVYIAGNIQPFLVMFFAWLLSKCSHTHVPKELLTKQSIQVKVTSFAFVFVGLALLA